MSRFGESERRRVFVPQALGADEFLRVTWHEGRDIVVFSHWHGDRCVAATPVRADALGELVELTVSAYVSGDSTAQFDAPWPAPLPEARLDPPAA